MCSFSLDSFKIFFISLVFQQFGYDVSRASLFVIFFFYGWHSLSFLNL